MIIYVPEPLELLQDTKSPERMMVKLPSGGYVSVEACDQRSARVVEIISTDPMDYMNSQIQPGSILEMEIKV